MKKIYEAPLIFFISAKWHWIACECVSASLSVDQFIFLLSLIYFMNGKAMRIIRYSFVRVCAPTSALYARNRDRDGETSTYFIQSHDNAAQQIFLAVQKFFVHFQ